MSTTPNVLTKLCLFDEMPIGIGLLFGVNGRAIAAFRTRSGAVYAVDNHCPHRGGPLADGLIAQDRVVCPLHAYRFRLQDGVCESQADCNIAVYTTHIADGWVVVEVPR